MKSIMQHAFNLIPSVQMERSVFRRDHGYKTTFNSGYLIPFLVDEIYPGDTFKVRATLFARLATPIVPVMDNIFLETFYFFVPNRLVWENWQRFMGERVDPENFDDPEVIAPVPTISNYADAPFQVQSIFDYMGLPTGTQVAGHIEANALPFRAYNLIYNQWFRDENLVDHAPQVAGDYDVLTNYELKRRGKRHDYFTSALPFPQKGIAVDIAMGTEAPVYGTGEGLGLFNGNAAFPLLSSQSGVLYSGPGGDVGDVVGYHYQPSGQYDPVHGETVVGLVTPGQIVDSAQSGLYADLSGATAITINALREAFAMQRMLEKDARGGTRYTEIIRNHFRVTSPDARMQRAEYLGGSSVRMMVSPVQQTAPNTTEENYSKRSDFGLGTLGAYGVAHDANSQFTKSFTEHGFIIGLVNVRCDLTYQQGLAKMWSRQVREDYYWPSFAHLGEQAVLNKEIWCCGITEEGEPGEQDNQIFGYQERYAELRYKNSQITGWYRSGLPLSLDLWHLSQDFGSTYADLPVLGTSFIEDNPPLRRLMAVQTIEEHPAPEILLDMYIQMTCARPMPTFSVPGLMDHF